MAILNQLAQQMIETPRGQHPVFIFTYRNKPLTQKLNSAWLNAKSKAQLSQLHVHDSKHTFGRRLRAANVSSRSIGPQKPTRHY